MVGHARVGRRMLSSIHAVRLMPACGMSHDACSMLHAFRVAACCTHAACCIWRLSRYALEAPVCRRCRRTKRNRFEIRTKSYSPARQQKPGCLLASRPSILPAWFIPFCGGWLALPVCQAVLSARPFADSPPPPLRDHSPLRLLHAHMRARASCRASAYASSAYAVPLGRRSGPDGAEDPRRGGQPRLVGGRGRGRALCMRPAQTHPPSTAEYLRALSSAASLCCTVSPLQSGRSRSRRSRTFAPARARGTH